MRATHQAVERLQAAGFTLDQAHAVLEVSTAADQATKNDLKELELRLTIHGVAALAATAGLVLVGVGALLALAGLY